MKNALLFAKQALEAILEDATHYEAVTGTETMTKKEYVTELLDWAGEELSRGAKL